MANMTLPTKELPIAPVLAKHQVQKMDLFGNLKPNTKRSYLFDLSLFALWMTGQEENEVDQDGKIIHLDEKEIISTFRSYEITPQLIVVWLQQRGFEYKFSTVQRKLSAISWILKTFNREVVSASEPVKFTLQTFKNLHDGYMAHTLTKNDIRKEGFVPPVDKPKRYEPTQAKPFRLEHLIQVIDWLDSGEHKLGKNRVARDKALVTMLWHGLYRRNEIVHQRIEQIHFTEHGLVAKLAMSKTGAIKKVIALAENPKYCAVRLLQAWLKRLPNGNEEGWCFCAVSRYDMVKKDGTIRLNGIDVNRILKSLSNDSGIKINFSGHSTRRGAATDIYQFKKDPLAVKNAGGWKSDVYMRYIDEDSADKFDTGVKGLI